MYMHASQNLTGRSNNKRLRGNGISPAYVWGRVEKLSVMLENWQLINGNFVFVFLMLNKLMKSLPVVN